MKNILKFFRLPKISDLPAAKDLINTNFKRIKDALDIYQNTFDTYLSILQDHEKELHNLNKLSKDFNERLDSLELRAKHSD